MELLSCAAHSAASLDPVLEAGLFDTLVGWIGGEVGALIISAALALLGSAVGVLFARLAGTFRELGEFLTVLGTAIEDHRLTREELARLVAEGREIFDIWR